MTGLEAIVWLTIGLALGWFLRPILEKKKQKEVDKHGLEEFHQKP